MDICEAVAVSVLKVTRGDNDSLQRSQRHFALLWRHCEGLMRGAVSLPPAQNITRSHGCKIHKRRLLARRNHSKRPQEYIEASKHSYARTMEPL